MNDYLYAMKALIKKVQKNLLESVDNFIENVNFLKKFLEVTVSYLYYDFC